MKHLFILLFLSLSAFANDTATCVAPANGQIMKLGNLQSAYVTQIPVEIYDGPSQLQLLSFQMTIANAQSADGFSVETGTATVAGFPTTGVLLVRPTLDEIGASGGLIYFGINYQAFVQNMPQTSGNVLGDSEKQQLIKFVCYGNQ